jgi:protein FAM50
VDVNRILRLQKEREQTQKQFQDQVSKLRKESQVGVVSISDKFSAQKSVLEEALKEETVGFHTLDEFQKKRLKVESQEQRQKESNAKKRKIAQINKSKLSFDLEEDEGDEEEFTISNKRAKTETESGSAPMKRLGKDPSVDTSFLPDKEREEREAQERERLKREWLIEQERIKSSELKVACSYYDGLAHRTHVTVTRGTTIEQFLETARREFTELRGVSVDSLLFVKEDVIIPHHYTFYELIETRARGKSGPLFEWEVKADIRLSDGTASNESHAAKIVTRQFWERNKHLHPLSRWEVFDPNKMSDVKRK